jgi:hypothetical protein
MLLCNVLVVCAGQGEGGLLVITNVFNQEPEERLREREGK